MDVIGDACGLDVRPFPFDVPVHGELIEDRVRLVAAVQRSLTGKGLADRDSLAPTVVRLVGLFARPQWSIGMLGSAGTQTYCVRTGSDGRSAVLAQRWGELVRFDPITPESVVRELVRLLPPAKPGPGASVTIALANESRTRGRHRRDDDAPDTFLQPGRPTRTTDGAQLGIARDILRRPRAGAGYFIVTERGPNGRDGEPQTMSWLDTDAGRYVVLSSVGADGQQYATYAPADLQRVENNLERLAGLRH
ncbi:ESX secretion-associated protein EspG [Actinocrispum wychmicini]|uniref:ESX secretion-associated protein EspG n=1 Tax=Actinocrispum wychmicini TaxID=1213861 RepID=UPI0014051C5B|nr:ESX secretion-associated protein EspG [Actinocrispum wychmicini]